MKNIVDLLESSAKGNFYGRMIISIFQSLAARARTAWAQKVRTVGVVPIVFLLCSPLYSSIDIWVWSSGKPDKLNFEHSVFRVYSPSSSKLLLVTWPSVSVRFSAGLYFVKICLPLLYIVCYWFNILWYSRVPQTSKDFTSEPMSLWRAHYCILTLVKLPQ